MTNDKEKDLARVARQPLADHGDLPRQATSAFERRGKQKPRRHRDELRTVIWRAFDLGLGTRAAARFAGCSTNTIAKYAKLLRPGVR